MARRINRACRAQNTASTGCRHLLLRLDGCCAFNRIVLIACAGRRFKVAGGIPDLANLTHRQQRGCLCASPLENFVRVLTLLAQSLSFALHSAVDSIAKTARIFKREDNLAVCILRAFSDHPLVAVGLVDR